MSRDWVQIFDATRSDETIVDLAMVASHFPKLRRSPLVIQILAENIVRQYGDDASTFLASLLDGKGEVPFKPHRVVMQDAASLPVIVDIAGLRDEAVARGRAPQSIQLGCRVDLVVDHSIRVDATGPHSFAVDARTIEYLRTTNRSEHTALAAAYARRQPLMAPENARATTPA